MKKLMFVLVLLGLVIIAGTVLELLTSWQLQLIALALVILWRSIQTPKETGDLFVFCFLAFIVAMVVGLVFGDKGFFLILQVTIFILFLSAFSIQYERTSEKGMSIVGLTVLFGIVGALLGFLSAGYLNNPIRTGNWNLIDPALPGIWMNGAITGLLWGPIAGWVLYVIVDATKTLLGFSELKAQAIKDIKRI